MPRSISEFIAVLVIVAIAVVGVAVVYNLAGTLLSRMQPKIKYLEAYVTGIEVVHSGSEVPVEVSGGTFRARYIYRVSIVLHNVGNQPISYLTYASIPVCDTISTCRHIDCDIYDPVRFTENHVVLPRRLEPNQAVRLVFIVLSKVDLLELGYSPFVIGVAGVLPDGSRCTVYVSVFGETR